MPLALAALAAAWFAHSVARTSEALTDDPDVAPPPAATLALPSLALGLAAALAIAWLVRR